MSELEKMPHYSKHYKMVNIPATLNKELLINKCFLLPLNEAQMAAIWVLHGRTDAVSPHRPPLWILKYRNKYDLDRMMLCIMQKVSLSVIL